MQGPGITDPAEEYFKDGVWGWDGTQWVKLSLLWGYSDRWAEIQYDANAAAGTNNLYTTAVPTGWVYRLRHVSAVDVTTNPTNIQLLLSDGVSTYPIKSQAAPGAGIYVDTFCDVTLKEGDSVGAAFAGCLLGDDIYLRAWGEKMRIA